MIRKKSLIFIFYPKILLLKPRLFINNDTTLWKLAPDTPKTVTELKTKKIEAFYYMLPNETK